MRKKRLSQRHGLEPLPDDWQPRKSPRYQLRWLGAGGPQPQSGVAQGPPPLPSGPPGPPPPPPQFHRQHPEPQKHQAQQQQQLALADVTREPDTAVALRNDGHLSVAAAQEPLMWHLAQRAHDDSREVARRLGTMQDMMGHLLQELAVQREITRRLERHHQQAQHVAQSTVEQSNVAWRDPSQRWWQSWQPIDHDGRWQQGHRMGGAAPEDEEWDESNSPW